MMSDIELVNANSTYWKIQPIWQKLKVLYRDTETRSGELVISTTTSCTRWWNVYYTQNNLYVKNILFINCDN